MLAEKKLILLSEQKKTINTNQPSTIMLDKKALLLTVFRNCDSHSQFSGMNKYIATVPPFPPHHGSAVNKILLIL